MTPREHYNKAEQLLEALEKSKGSGMNQVVQWSDGTWLYRDLIAIVQVHATLATYAYPLERL